jgi:hypothetical protein
MLSNKFSFIYVHFTGGFLSDAGWFSESEKVLLACQDLCQRAEPLGKYWHKLLECYHRYVSFRVESIVYYFLFLVDFVEAVSYFHRKCS